jgi:hypothetical protein
LLKIHTGHTTTLIRHLTNKPHWNREYWKKKELTSKNGTTKLTSKQPTVDSGFVITVKISPSEPIAEATTSINGKIMVVDYQPYSVEAEGGFQEFLHTLEPRRQVPS